MEVKVRGWRIEDGGRDIINYDHETSDVFFEVKGLTLSTANLVICFTLLEDYFG